MAKLPPISGKELVKILEKNGYQVARKKGSHVRLKHHDPKNFKPVTVPLHKEPKHGLLHKILKDSNVDI